MSFDRDRTGRVVGLRMHEGGQEFEVPREGVTVAPEIPLSELHKYVGSYRDAAGATRDQCPRISGSPSVAEQRVARSPSPRRHRTPRGARERRDRLCVRGHASRCSVSHELLSPRRAADAVDTGRDHLTVAEIMTLRRIPAASAISTTRGRPAGSLPQSGVEGSFSSSTAGDDRLRIDINLDTSVQIRTVLNKGRASVAASGASSSDLTGKALAQMRLGHPAVLFGDWRKYYDTVRVVRAGELGGERSMASSSSRPACRPHWWPWTRRPATCFRIGERCRLRKPAR